MKSIRIKNIAMLALVSLLLNSCQKDNQIEFVGSYSYKTGGQLKALPTVLTGDQVDVVAACSELSGYDLANLWVPLAPETGQMGIVFTNEAEDSLILTFTALLGDICTMTGTLKGDSLTLTGENIKSMQVTDGTNTLGGGFVKVTGNGIRYKDAFILNLSYEGTITSSVTGRNVEMTIMDNRIQCVAQTVTRFGDIFVYKTGGQVKMMPTVLTDSVVDPIDACSTLSGYDLHDLRIALKPESGSMNIVSAGDTDETLSLTFNTLLGDICTLTANVQGDRLALTGSNNTKTMQLSDGENTIGGGIVQVTGNGERKDDMLVLDLNYHGTFTSTLSGRNIEMTIMESNVQCVAKRNK